MEPEGSFIGVFTRIHHWSLSWPRCIQSTISCHISPMIHSNVIFPSMAKRSELSLPFRFSDKNFVCISHLSRACYTPLPSHTLSFDHPNNIWWSSQEAWNVCKIQDRKIHVYSSTMPWRDIFSLDIISHGTRIFSEQTGSRFRKFQSQASNFAFVDTITKPEEKRPLGRHGQRWEDNIRMYVRKIRWEAWTGCIWLWIGTSGGLLWTW